MVRLIPSAVDLKMDVSDGTVTPIKLKLQMIQCGGHGLMPQQLTYIWMCSW